MFEKLHWQTGTLIVDNTTLFRLQHISIKLQHELCWKYISVARYTIKKPGILKDNKHIYAITNTARSTGPRRWLRLDVPCHSEDHIGDWNNSKENLINMKRCWLPTKSVEITGILVASARSGQCLAESELRRCASLFEQSSRAVQGKRQYQFTSLWQRLLRSYYVAPLFRLFSQSLRTFPRD